MRALKAANPALKVLQYKNLSAISSLGDGPEYSSGVGRPQARPEWLLKDSGGRPFTFWNYDWMWAADIGARGYQDAWAENVIADLEGDGWDGVFLDDANYSIKYHFDQDEVAKYPTASQYGAAMRSMLANVGPRIRGAGKLAFANVQWAEYSSQANDWMQFLDGGMDEVFVKWGRSPHEGYADLGRWSIQLANVKEAARRGKAMLAVTQSTNGDRDAARFGWATALLAGEGNVHFALHGDYTSENWFPEYDIELGAPLGPESSDRSGVHRRVFASGLVLVNPTSSPQTVEFGGLYSGSGLTAATSARMAPHSGLILSRIGSGADAGGLPVSQPSPASPGLAGAPAAATIPQTQEAPATATATAVGARPAMPRRLRARRKGARVQLTWRPGGPGVQRFQVRRNGRVVAGQLSRRAFAEASSRRRVRYQVRAVSIAGSFSRCSSPASVAPRRSTTR